MKRIALVVALVTLLPLLTGAGGSNPPPPGFKIGGPIFNASVVLDPHEPGVTTHAGQGSIRIYYINKGAAAMVTVPVFGFPLFRGCDLSLTDVRFRQRPLSDWIDDQNLIIEDMFTQLGITISGAMVPAITKIENDQCTPDPDNPGPLLNSDNSSSEPGILSFGATIRFLCSKGVCPK